MSGSEATGSDADVERWIEDIREWLVSDTVLDILELSLTISLHGVLSLTGVLSNSVNVLVFIRLGLKDSMSVGLWALSFTDLVVSALQFSGCVSYLFSYLYPDSPIDAWTLGAFVFSWARYIGYLISCWITTTITLERWYCVIAPFHVKEIFTKTKCIVSLVCIYITHIGVHVPIFIFAPLEWVQNPTGETNFNGSYDLKFQVVFTEESSNWETIADLVAGVVCSLISQGIIIICTFWMIYSLKASSRIRQQVKGKNPEITDNLSAREKRLVKVVILLAIILTVCNIPRFLATAVHHLLPGMKLGAYRNLETLMWEVSYIFSTVCCTSNIFVYLLLNANFRRYFNAMFAPACTHIPCTKRRSSEEFIASSD